MSVKKYVITTIFSFVIAVALLAFLFIRTNELSEARNSITNLETDIATTQNIIADRETQIDVTEDSIETAEEQLDQTQTELVDVQDELDTTQVKLENEELRLTSLTADLAEAKESIKELEDSFENLQALYDEIADRYNNILIDYETVTGSYGYVLKDPSYNMMMDFLSNDNTSQKPYVAIHEVQTPDWYICGDYSAETVINAAQAGFRCAFVYVYFKGMPHALIAFNTTDRGLIFIEPQEDAEVDLRIGEHYWASVINPVTGYSGYIPTPQDYDDTVERYFVIW